MRRIARICLSALLAYAVAALVFMPLFFLLWPVFYWGWHYVGRHRAAHGLRTLLWIEEKKPAGAHIAKERSGLGQVVRAMGLTMAARYSFKVIFDRDGRVQEVTPLYGSGPN